MKFRIYSDRKIKENIVIILAQILFENIISKNFKYVCVQYSEERISSGPLYADFELDV